jgi:hypothetical protein
MKVNVISGETSGVLKPRRLYNVITYKYKYDTFYRKALACFAEREPVD